MRWNRMCRTGPVNSINSILINFLSFQMLLFECNEWNVLLHQRKSCFHNKSPWTSPNPLKDAFDKIFLLIRNKFEWILNNNCSVCIVYVEMNGHRNTFLSPVWRKQFQFRNEKKLFMIQSLAIKRNDERIAKKLHFNQ